jgi:hypothetical protein
MTQPLSVVEFSGYFIALSGRSWDQSGENDKEDVSGGNSDGDVNSLSASSRGQALSHKQTTSPDKSCDNRCG